MRYVILHHHLFKNAGTTLDGSLEDQFGSDFATLHDPGEDGLITPQMLADFLAENRSVVAISSHHFLGQYFFRGQDLPIRTIDIMMLRDPVDRLRSTYNFYRRVESADPISGAAKSLNPKDFIKLLVERYPQYVDNNQVNSVANRSFYCRPVGRCDFDCAAERVRSFALCAPLDRYDEAMVTLEHFASPSFSPHRLDLSYVRQNCSGTGLSRSSFASQIGDALSCSLDDLTKLDRELIEVSSRELDRRIALVPDFTKKLANFVDRCRSKEFRYRRHASRHAA